MAKQLSAPIVLVISDNPSVRYWLKKQLNEQFFIIEATKKNKAIESAEHTALHFIILDADFEESDFLDVCKAIRRTASNALTPILLITDRLKKSYRGIAKTAGVTDFLSQPLDAEELSTKIATAKQATNVRHKIATLSFQIKAPNLEASSTFFKQKFLMQDQVLQFLSRAKKKNLVVTLLVIRIDRFTEMQSTLDDDSSQEILHEFITFLKRNVGKKDRVLPSSDGTFIVLLPGTQLQESQVIAEKLRKQIEQHKFSTQRGLVHLTASFALSSIESTEKSFNHMIDAADKSLQQSLSLTNQIFLIDKDKP